MSDEHYSGRRLNSLSRGPGLLDSLYGLCVKAKKGLREIFAEASVEKDTKLSLVATPKQAPAVPAHIFCMDTEFVYVASDYFEKLITPFCEYNNIQPIRPTMPFFSPTTVVLSRSELKDLNSKASIIASSPDRTYLQNYLARAMSYDFEFLAYYKTIPPRYTLFRSQAEPSIDHNLT